MGKSKGTDFLVIVTAALVSTLQIQELVTPSHAFGYAFAPAIGVVARRSLTHLHATKNKLSYAQKKKRRSQKQRTNISTLKDTSNIQPDKWDKVTRTSTSSDGNTPTKEEMDTAEVQQQASALIEAQRQSVNTLNLVKGGIDQLSKEDLSNALSSDNYYTIIDNFLSDSTLVQALADEGRSLLKDKHLSILQVGSGEFGAPLTGGDKYAQSPRSVEWVVGMTKNFPPMVKELNLVDSASIGSVMAFDRQAKLKSLELLYGSSGNADGDTGTIDRPFEYANGGDDTDSRKVTAIYFTTEEGWEKGFGGGITVRPSEEKEDDVEIEVKRDRLVLLRSDKCLHRRNEWRGKEDMDHIHGGCLVTHFIKG